MATDCHLSQLPDADMCTDIRLRLGMPTLSISICGVADSEQFSKLTFLTSNALLLFLTSWALHADFGSGLVVSIQHIIHE